MCQCQGERVRVDLSTWRTERKRKKTEKTKREERRGRRGKREERRREETRGEGETREGLLSSSQERRTAVSPFRSLPELHPHEARARERRLRGPPPTLQACAPLRPGRRALLLPQVELRVSVKDPTHTHTDAKSLQALEALESYTGGSFFFEASATSYGGPVSRRGSGEVPIQSQECRRLRLRAAWRILQLSRGGSGLLQGLRPEAPGLPPGHQERPGARAEEPARPGEPSYVPCPVVSDSERAGKGKEEDLDTDKAKARRRDTQKTAPWPATSLCSASCMWIGANSGEGEAESSPSEGGPKREGEG